MVPAETYAEDESTGCVSKGADTAVAVAPTWPALDGSSVRCHAGSVRALPTGVVSFVLTDVVGSTELWERAPDEMAKALARHDVLLTAAVEAEGGMVLKAGGESDSTFSVFPRATDAFRAGHRLQAAVCAEAWPAAAVIRVAVHTGEAVERDGDYFGPAVKRGTRLRGAARGGEVVVSATRGHFHRPPRRMRPGRALRAAVPGALDGNPRCSW